MHPALLRTFVLTILFAFESSGVSLAQQPADGIFVTVANPITDGQFNQIKAHVEKERSAPGRNIKTVIFDFNPDGKNAATESYGIASELADYIRSLVQNGMTTVAWVHGKVSFHTVLPVLACDDLTMATGSQIGPVWTAERPVTDNQVAHYMKLAGISRAGAVLKMIDKDVRLVQATLGGATIWVDLRKVEAKEKGYEEVIVTDRTPKLGPGIETYSVEQSFKYLQMKFQADDRASLKERYKLTDLADRADPLGGAQPAGCRIVLQGPIDMGQKGAVLRQVESAKSRKENTFFFVFESAGGDPKAARELADEIIAIGQNKDYRARTIAFIPGNAPDLSLMVALACQDIWMFKGSDPAGEAVLGDFRAFIEGGNPQQKNRVNVEILRKNLVDVSEKSNKGVSPILIDGLFDRNLVIVRAVNGQTGETKLMSETELKSPAGQGWAMRDTIKAKGDLLKFNASMAKNLRLAKTTDNKDIAEVYSAYGLDKVRSAEASWLDNMAAFLRRPGISILLVIVGIAGLVLELKAPGLVIPGVIAAVCFILFFWSQTQLGGQLIYLAIMLFLLGLALLGVEIFLIPGFGVTGVSGIVLMLAGLVLAGLDKAPESASDWVDLVGKMLRYGLTMAVAGVLSFGISRYLPNIPYANRLMLRPPDEASETETESSPLPGVDAAMSLLGQVGNTVSMLRPSGLAKFGEKFFDVVTEGDFIEPGTPVQVIEVEGSRIVVKRT